jgi:hypothetical protein
MRTSRFQALRLPSPDRPENLNFRERALASRDRLTVARGAQENIVKSFLKRNATLVRLTWRRPYMKNRAKKHLMKLQDVIDAVSRFARNDHETGLVVADLINRGFVRVHTQGNGRRIVVR